MPHLLSRNVHQSCFKWGRGSFESVGLRITEGDPGFPQVRESASLPKVHFAMPAADFMKLARLWGLDSYPAGNGPSQALEKLGSELLGVPRACSLGNHLPLDLRVNQE